MISAYKNCLLISLLLVLFSKGVISQPAGPSLMLETGMHNSRCNSLSADIGGRYLLTCSNDKTARFWEAATGKLINTLRIPIGSLDNGKLYACALSPESKVAAVGGWTAGEQENNCIYILNPFTAQITNSICDLGEVVNRLEFSRDGHWLAVGLGDNGVRIFNTQTWQLTKSIKGYKGGVYGLSFSKQGNLVTSCFDGFLRMYRAPDFALVTQTNSLSGDKPYSVVFNALGTLIAVGYNSNPTVEVFHANNLQIAYKPDISEIPFNQDVSAVGFSDDGNTLFAGGAYVDEADQGNSKYAVRKWTNAGKGKYQDFPLLQNTVLGIKPLAGGNMALIGAYPDLAVFDQAGTVLWYKAAENMNFAVDNSADFLLSADEKTVSMRSAYGYGLFFDISNRSINNDRSLYYPPITENGRLRLTAWKNTDNPSVNNLSLDFLAPDETCRSACLSSDGSRIAWGADYNLYLTDNKGQVIWRTSLPETAFAINIAGHGKAVVVALGDGTIRWYSIITGKELLVFYSSTDRRRWVLFTPKGYYDASPGAEDFLGWHVNNGPFKTPAFYPASIFKETYYRPDIIDAITESWDEEMAISTSISTNNRKSQTITSEKLPPTIVITDPYSNTSFTDDLVTIRYTVQSSDNAPAGNVEVRVNSRPVIVQRGAGIEVNKLNTIRLSIPRENCTISLTAENAYGVSPEAKVFLKYDSINKVKTKERKSRLFVLSIGISDYDNPAYKLNYAAIDAASFIDCIEKQRGVYYDDVVVKKLIDKEATQNKMLAALDWIQKQTTENDVAMIFYAGHGINNNNGIYYMGPVEADFKNLKTSCMDFNLLVSTVREIRGKVVVFIDACYSGNVTGGQITFGNIGRVISDLGSARYGGVVFTSSTGKEPSLESSQWGHGAFTKALLEGLNGAGASKIDKTKINIKSLDSFISDRVKELTNGWQQPTSIVPPDSPDFTIAVQN